MRARWVMGVGVLLALAAAVLLLRLPMYDVAAGGTVGGVVTDSARRATMVEVEGLSVLPPMLLPVLVALVAWASPWTWLRWTLVALLALFCLLGLLTVGLFYLPAAVALAAGAALAQAGPRTGPRTAEGSAWTAP
ncbi:hypothetical protein [Phycicoccus flavus]|uniref:hypothetical protein n=1 Tax=Phycicoccus flavus TaxID=2502783 RepID=UPI000FEBBF22|nr:hypothetical protein [Phycicoccus flavus]NHA67357.1 hypothetical protein [Phycicoccus flavus]